MERLCLKCRQYVNIQSFIYLSIYLSIWQMINKYVVLDILFSSVRNINFSRIRFFMAFLEGVHCNDIPHPRFHPPSSAWHPGWCTGSSRPPLCHQVDICTNCNPSPSVPCSPRSPFYLYSSLRHGDTPGRPRPPACHQRKKEDKKDKKKRTKKTKRPPACHQVGRCTICNPPSTSCSPRSPSSLYQLGIRCVPT